MNRLEDKVAIVTGAAHGIGQAISQVFAEEGAWVLVADIDEKAGEKTAAGIRQKGGEASFCRCDISSQQDVEHAVKQTLAQTNRIDVLCNNAAYLGDFHDVLGAGDKEWQRSLDVALMGTQRFTRAVLPHMIEKKRGSIINVVSIQGMVACPTSVTYTTVKAGLLGFTRSVAYDYGSSNIRVNSLSPGPIQTRISPKPGEAAYEYQVKNTVLGRVGYPKEVAYAALFLASDEASYITGINLPVDGGWTAM